MILTAARSLEEHAERRLRPSAVAFRRVRVELLEPSPLKLGQRVDVEIER